MAHVYDFHYDLPEELIAQEPLADRSASRMLVLSRETGVIRDELFLNIPAYLRPGDCLVLNNTRVFPARLRGRRNHPTGAEIEVFLIRSLDSEDRDWQALVKPGKRVRIGDRVLFAPGFECEILTHGDFGERTIRLHTQEPVAAAIQKVGSVPLPPYIHREADSSDQERYQTVFAKWRGSVAAPTAGLHFTSQVLDRCREAGAAVAQVTLHVGLGTFAPLRVDTLDEIHLHSEHFQITAAEAGVMNAASRLCCVGTTSVRTVESAYLQGGLTAMESETDLFIKPGFPFQGTGAMLTNFHLPQSSLLILVSAFAGKDAVLAAYKHAVRERYRFFSYGDCMLIV